MSMHVLSHSETRLRDIHEGDPSYFKMKITSRRFERSVGTVWT